MVGSPLDRAQGDASTEASALDLASELFHRINRIIPSQQQVLTIGPSMLVRDAVKLMRQHGYSQLPVVNNGEVLGVFSYRSLAHGTADVPLSIWTQEKRAPSDLPVEEFIEQFDYFRVTEEISRLFDSLDRNGGALVGGPERLIGILTSTDILRYLYEIASPFVLVSEIELAVRALIRKALSEEQIADAARLTLGAVYEGRDRMPTTLEEMSFDNYRTLVAHGGTWPRMEPVFGGTRVRTAAKLKEIGEIRNDLFHFKREITASDHQTLAEHRDWLLRRCKVVGALPPVDART